MLSGEHTVPNSLFTLRTRWERTLFPVPFLSSERKTKGAGCAHAQELAARNKAIGAQMAELQKQARETERGMDAALMALGIDREAAERDPEAAAATANVAFNSRMFKVGKEGLTMECSAQQPHV